jgi:pimeloyl-ACP methyl ester carboxylesterase
MKRRYAIFDIHSLHQDSMARKKSPPVAAASNGTNVGHIIIGQDVGLAYAERGDGPPVVFIPHWTFTKEAFTYQLNALSGRYRVICYDPRSQGESSFSHEGNDYITHAHDLASLLETIGAVRPVLVGWGTGALTAWNYVRLKGPQAIAGMVAVDMPPQPLSPHDSDWREGTLEEVAAIHTLFLRDTRGLETYLRRTIETTMVERALADDELTGMLSYSLRTSPLVAAQLFASAMFADLTNAAAATARAVPTLFFLASARAPAAIETIERLMPEARYVTFGGRMMFWEHHAAFNHVLSEFIEEQMLAAANAPAANRIATPETL